MNDYINAKGKQLEGTVNSEIPSYKCNMSIHTDRNLFVCFFSACTVTFYQLNVESEDCCFHGQEMTTFKHGQPSGSNTKWLILQKDYY